MLTAPTPFRNRTRRVRTAGFSLVEFLLVSVPVLLLTLGGIELAHWFHVRQVVGLALVEAARAGATQHAQPAAIAQAFEQALRPLFTGASPEVTDARLQAAMRNRSRAMDGNPPWQIRIVRPDARDFTQFATPTLTIARNSGLPAIRNDYQAEQQHRYTLAHTGDTPAEEDTNASRDATVFQANILVLRLSYPHPPLLAGVAHLLTGLHIHTDDYTRRALTAGLLPMIREVHLDMASHPVDWPSLLDGRVIKGLASGTVPDGSPASRSVPGGLPCAGLWCQPQALRPLPQLPESGLPDEMGESIASDWEGWGFGNGAADGARSAEDTTLIDDECL